MNIKRKILGLFICLMMLATVPLAAGVTQEENDPQTTDLGQEEATGVIVRGPLVQLRR